MATLQSSLFRYRSLHRQVRNDEEDSLKEHGDTSVELATEQNIMRSCPFIVLTTTGTEGFKMNRVSK
jgi:hypothetical protein